MNPIRTVIGLHGFWSHGTGMLLIKHRLEKEYGLRVLLFSYPSVSGTLDDNATALARFIRTQELDGVHMIGHSLGGIVALRMLAKYPDSLPGRVVCLGSPLCGSSAAEFLQNQDWAELIVGRSLPDGVVQQTANEWAAHLCETRDIGVIAGTVPFGVGQLVANIKEENDGTVAVSETRLAGAKDHICLPVSHKGMLVSRNVVDQAAAFLQRGEFLREMM